MKPVSALILSLILLTACGACAAAIGYAAAHPQILTPLGSDYHGAQSHRYVPADVCPFR